MVNKKRQIISAKKHYQSWKTINKMQKQSQDSANESGLEWIENFNIGSIMHMVPMKYNEFSTFNEIMFEVAHKSILEKIIY